MGFVFWLSNKLFCLEKMEIIVQFESAFLKSVYDIIFFWFKHKILPKYYDIPYEIINQI